MSRVAERSGVTLLAAVVLGALVYLALPVEAGVDSTANESARCAKSTRQGVVLADCSEGGWLAGLPFTDRFLGVQTKFSEPIF